MGNFDDGDSLDLKSDKERVLSSLVVLSISLKHLHSALGSTRTTKNWKNVPLNDLTERLLSPMAE